MKISSLLILVVILAGSAWTLRDSEFAQRLMAEVPRSLPFRFDRDARVTAPADGSNKLGNSISAGLRKCKRGAEVLYTNANGPCPAGTTEEMMSGGTVTSVAMPKPVILPTPKDEAPKNPPTVKDLLAPGEDINLTERRMEQVLGK